MIFCLAMLIASCVCYASVDADTTFYAPNNPMIQYVGRIDFTKPNLPKFWQPGVYITAKFTGKYCVVLLNDEMLYGTNHNYVEIIIDNKNFIRIKLTEKKNAILAANYLDSGEHTITICKNTEAGIGSLTFAGLKCKALLQPDAKPVRRIEFIGNSITSGMANDLSEIPCGKGEWYDQHNAYLSYGPITARALNAQWQLSSVSGIGLIHSCCAMAVTMPQVFDKINMRDDSIKWNFSSYIPDVVTVCLGQNDGIQDSSSFCKSYIQFIQRLRVYYPNAHIVCLNSPMGDEQLNPVLKRYISALVQVINKQGDNYVSNFFYSKRYHNGCGDHPDLEEHKQMADELTGYLKKLMNW